MGSTWKRKILRKWEQSLTVKARWLLEKRGAQEIPKYRMGVKKHHNISHEFVSHVPKDYLHLWQSFCLHRFERMTSSSTSSSPTWWPSLSKPTPAAIFIGRRSFASLSGLFLPPYIFYVLFFSGIQCLLKIFQGIISIFDWTLSKLISLGSLISTMMVSSTRKSFVGWPLQTWSVQRSFKPFFRWFINHFLWLLCDCNHFQVFRILIDIVMLSWW